MSLLDQLLPKQHEPPAAVAGASAIPRLDIGGASDAQVVAALEQCFGADDDRDAMVLVRFGKPLGTVKREAVYELVADSLKGVGGQFDHAMLPGVPDFVPSRFVCPQPGCGHSLYVITLMVSGVVGDCPLHPGTALVEAPR